MDLKSGVFEWSLTQLAVALKISEKDVKKYFTDGRRVSFILERRIAFEVVHGTLAKSEGAGYDLFDPHGGKWEVRSITRDGIYFCPSYMVGSGRSFNQEGFLQKLDDIKGYIVADVIKFPQIPFWIIPVENIRRWWQEGKLGTSTKINRITAYQLISQIYDIYEK
jgi:hypothetical protein